jgi:hypothetical protein
VYYEQDEEPYLAPRYVDAEDLTESLFDDSDQEEKLNAQQYAIRLAYKTMINEPDTVYRYSNSRLMMAGVTKKERTDDVSLTEPLLKVLQKKRESTVSSGASLRNILIQNSCWHWASLSSMILAMQTRSEWSSTCQELWALLSPNSPNDTWEQCLINH